MARPIYEIAQEILAKWPKVSPYAKPYLDAMLSLTDTKDSYYFDSAKEIVLYFLANASSFKGEDARRLKNELKELTKSK